MVAQLTSAQIIQEIPSIDGHIVFAEVVKLDSVSKEEIYRRAKNYFITQFKSAKDVVQMDDKEEATVVGRGWQDIYVQAGIETFAIQMWYKVRIQGKDDRYKYDVFDIEFTSYASQYAASSTSPAENIFDVKAYYNQRGKPRNIPERYKDQTLKAVEGISAGIKKAMLVNVKGKDDW